MPPHRKFRYLLYGSSRLHVDISGGGGLDVNRRRLLEEESSLRCQECSQEKSMLWLFFDRANQLAHCHQHYFRILYTRGIEDHRHPLTYFDSDQSLSFR